MKNKKQLFKDLDAYYGTTKYSEGGLSTTGVGNETYGTKSMIYLWSLGSPEKRKDLERYLANQGHKVHKRYWPGSDHSEIQVTYFKGFHWDE